MGLPYTLILYRSFVYLLIYFHLSFHCNILLLTVSVPGHYVCTLQGTEHYENMHMQDTAIFHGCKNDNFRLIFF